MKAYQIQLKKREQADMFEAQEGMTAKLFRKMALSIVKCTQPGAQTRSASSRRLQHEGTGGGVRVSTALMAMCEARKRGGTPIRCTR